MTSSREDSFLNHLRSLGLGNVERLVLTRNRSVVVSFRSGELRVNEGFVSAPEEVQREIVRFLCARRRVERLAARRVIVSYPLGESNRAPRSVPRDRPEDRELIQRLTVWHAHFNEARFGNSLGAVRIRISRRMVRRLGHYAPGEGSADAEIAISARHLRRDGIESALDTLLHEMVHQWQHESGLPLDHGRVFRAKCREVGALARARR